MLTPHPRILVLDEPTSALDPTAAEDVLAAVNRLVHDLGITVVMAEHRLERVVHHADHVVLLDGAGRATHTTPAVGLATSELAPPVVRLGRVAGWDPLPLSVRDARRHAGPLRERLAGRAPEAAAPPARKGGVEAEGIVVRYGDVVALRGVDLQVGAGEIVALMGRNGSGKSSLLWALHPAGRRQAGTVTVDGRVATDVHARHRRPRAADAVRPPLPRHRRRGVRPVRPRDGPADRQTIIINHDQGKNFFTKKFNHT